jgi:hypothetical protein
MPQPDTEIDLDQLIDAITASIAGAFPTFATVEAYREDRKTLPLPACLVQLVDLEPTEDIGTEQLPVIANFEALVILGFRTDAVKRAAPKLAASLALHIKSKRWGLPVEPATVTAIEPDNFDPRLDEFEVWRVDWRQIIHIGESIWNDDGTFPSNVLVSFAPDVGEESEGEYQAIVGGAP